MAVYTICNRYGLFLLVVVLCRPGMYSVQYNQLLINCAFVGLLYKQITCYFIHKEGRGSVEKVKEVKRFY